MMVSMQWIFPLLYTRFPEKNEPAAFGFRRKYDIHTGVDFYTEENAEVYAVEDGEVVKVDYFTGPNVNSPWWNETKAVMIEGQSGVVNYGEIDPYYKVQIGQKIKQGEVIGKVIPVLPADKLRADIPDHSCSMLHMELYEQGYRGDFAEWKLNEPMPKGLLDPTVRLFNSNQEPFWYIALIYEQFHCDKCHTEISITGNHDEFAKHIKFLGWHCEWITVDCQETLVQSCPRCKT